MTKNNLTIQKGANIHLSPDIEALFQTMFRGYQRLAIEAEFGRGLSGGRVFRVRLIDQNETSQLSSVVKVAPKAMIEQEWRAYQTYVNRTLPQAARLEASPVFMEETQLGGLHYAMAGAGIFAVQSLLEFYDQADIADLEWLLLTRLDKMMGVSWWRNHRHPPTYQMQLDYDSILPPNLLISPLATPPDTAYKMLSPDHLTTAFQPGDVVQLSGFTVTEVDLQAQRITLNLPSSESAMHAFRLRLINLPDATAYQAGQLIDPIFGRIEETRQKQLTTLVAELLGPQLVLSESTIDCVAYATASYNPPLPPTLPNPLLAYPAILQDFCKVYRSPIHGDFNLENILVDPETKEVSIIDFATVRQGHVMQDMLRLETEVLTKIVPTLIKPEAKPLPLIYALYCHLDWANGQTEVDFPQGQLPANLEKPFRFIHLIRRLAQTYLFDANDWSEYYRGLAIYLLGALKFYNLTAHPTAPLPRQVAFWGSACVLDLLESGADIGIAEPKASRHKRKPIGRLAIGVMVTMLAIVAVMTVTIWFGTFGATEPKITVDLLSASPYTLTDPTLDLEPDNQFFLIRVNIANMSDEPIQIQPSNLLFLTDGDGTLYSIDRNAVKSHLKVARLTTMSLLPKQTQSVEAVFQIPAQVKPTHLVYKAANKDGAEDENLAEIPLITVAQPTESPTNHEPVARLQVAFAAVLNGDFERLPAFCDPLNEHDVDTQAFCTLTADSPQLAILRSTLQSAQFSDQIRYSDDGQKAQFKMHFGPLGRRQRIITMIKRDGEWYLYNWGPRQE